MFDDPNYSNEIERHALDTYLAYLAGDASLADALTAMRTLVDVPPMAPSGDEADAADAEIDDLLNIDLTPLPPDQQERHAAFVRAIEAAYPDTP